MSDKIVDYLGNELKVGDKVLRTGRRTFVWGEITGFRVRQQYGRMVNYVGVKSQYSGMKNDKPGYTYPHRLIKQVK